MFIKHLFLSTLLFIYSKMALAVERRMGVGDNIFTHETPIDPNKPLIYRLYVLGMPADYGILWIKNDIYAITYEQTPICEKYVSFHGKYTVGEIPQVKPTVMARLDWDSSLSLSYLEALKNDSYIVKKQGMCFWSDESNQLNEVSRFILQSKKTQRQFLAYLGHNYVYEFINYDFDATANLAFYESNPKNGTVLEKTFDIYPTGYLENKYFFTDVTVGSRIHDEDLNFIRDTSDPFFTEVNVFAHANRALQWMQKLDTDFAFNPIELKVHDSIDGSINNALYIPESKEMDHAQIRIGDGDNIILQNLALDEDVISHELGHHFVFQALLSTRQVERREREDKSRDEHSLALHEGLADYFTMARTDDPCLGNSICTDPEVEGVCYVAKECLRTADQDIRYDSEMYWDFGKKTHLKSQIVSGLLWDIRTHNGANKDEIDTLVYQAVMLLPARAQYKDLISGLFLYNEEHLSGKYFEILKEASMNRGFELATSQIVASIEEKRKEKLDSSTTLEKTKTIEEDPLPLDDSIKNLDSQKNESSGGESNQKSCGVVGEDKSLLGAYPLYLLLALFLIRI